MTININIDESTVFSKDTEKIKKSLKPVMEDSELVKRYENSIAFNFSTSGRNAAGFFELVNKFGKAEYKQWFRTLDKEIPALPYFLSNKEGRNTLLLYLMGVLDYRESENNIVFDSIGANRFFKEKISEIKNLCFSNNINPQNSISRLSSILCDPASEEPQAKPAQDAEKPPVVPPPLPEKKEEPQETAAPAPANKETAALKKLLDRYGSLAVFKEGRITKIFLVFSKMPEHINFARNEIVIDRVMNTSFFRTVFDIDGSAHDIKSILLYKLGEVVESIKANNGVRIEGIIKGDDGEYQKFFELEELVKTDIVEIKNEPPKPVAEPQPAAASQITPPPLPVAKTKEPEIVLSDSELIDKLKKENARLKEENENLHNVVDALEQALHKKSSGFFRKFFK